MSCLSEYCISNTSFPSYNDNFSSNGNYDEYPSWSGITNGYFIYFKTETTQWCLSNTLGGNCLLSGKSPCTSECPDLYGTYFSTGICLTPTPTPTNNCSVLDFESFFDCSPISFITPTPTPTMTTTPTTTPTTTNYCNILKVDAEIISVSSSPTPTPTMTPTSSRPITRDCSFLGDVTFNTINTNINCPISKQFSDCNDPNIIYTTTDVLIVQGGSELSQYMTFNADVDGNTKCISYIGVTYDIIGGNTIVLNSPPLGYSNLGGCTFCQPTRTPTPTPTGTPMSTPTPTPTMTNTPTMTKTPTQTKTPTPTMTNTQTPTQTNTQTPTPSPPTIAQCLTNFRVVIAYYNEAEYISTNVSNVSRNLSETTPLTFIGGGGSSAGTCTTPDCQPCGKGPNTHNCNSARFYISANNINLYDNIDPTKNTLSINNNDGTVYPQNDNYNYPTVAPFPIGYVGLSRYDEMTIGATQAAQLSASSSDGYISFALVCAMNPGVNCHQDITWVRLYRNDVEIYNGCPTGNFLSINPCTGQIKPIVVPALA